MGMIERVFSLLFGGGEGALKETIEVFRENAEDTAGRDHAARRAALHQFAAEFTHPRKSIFDQFIDGLNRVPRPAMALGTLGLFVAAMWDPEWFASRMQGIALVPEPLWWLLGAVVSFYFGARHQLKGQEFQKSLAQSAAAAGALSIDLDGQTDDVEDGVPDVKLATRFAENAALEDWRLSRRG
ncbi:holin family protein [Shimia ponticola]|uniref:holin family protein n=1 Tax=Shimia ponticola TaxID=2582893 RepID=UPI0011BF77B2|nr:holin family protein [Shimia ponticola]